MSTSSRRVACNGFERDIVMLCCHQENCRFILSNDCSVDRVYWVVCASAFLSSTASVAAAAAWPASSSLTQGCKAMASVMSRLHTFESRSYRLTNQLLLIKLHLSFRKHMQRQSGKSWPTTQHTSSIRRSLTDSSTVRIFMMLRNVLTSEPGQGSFFSASSVVSAPVFPLHPAKLIIPAQTAEG